MWDGAESHGCVDNDGNAVDWYFTYKMPSGYKIAYIDANTEGLNSGPLHLFDRSLDDDNAVAVIRTLRSLVSKEDYILYNDQPDVGRASSMYGHAKGVVAVNADGGGFWLIHSTPHFPSSSGKGAFFFPEKEVIYGQTFLCITLGSGDIEKVAKQLLYIKPYVYTSTLSEATQRKFPTLGRVMEQDWVNDKGTNMENFQVGSIMFTHFAKNTAWNGDIFERLIAPHYRTGLLVETWLRGKACGTYCRPEKEYDVMDVQSMVAVGTSGQKVTWTESHDHAKWAVAVDNSKVLCVGDTNRMTSQRKRGGGAFCFKHEGLATALFSSIENADTCGNKAVKDLQSRFSSSAPPRDVLYV